MQLTFTISDAVAQRVVDAFAVQYNRPELVPDPANPGQYIPNPETKAAFARRLTKEYIKGVVKAAEASQAAEAARLAAIVDVDADIVIT